MTRWLVRRSLVEGQAPVPGDKSISHRALMLAALANGQSTITGLAPGADVRSTAECLAALGVSVEMSETTAKVLGEALHEPEHELDAGNSGTTIRLLSGILAGQPFETRIGGDESLCRRPMGRIIDPLQHMGARIQSNDGRAPLRITGGDLQPIKLLPDVASAQVKSCVLLAALFADGETRVREPTPTRDHTERMLRFAGLPLAMSDGALSLTGPARPDAFDLSVPGDISSAAFLVAAGLITGGEVRVDDVGLNPTRTGFLDAVEKMGCRVTGSNERASGGEPVGSILVEPGDLHGIQIGGSDVPRLIDELPLVAALATLARGETRVTGAAELRVKESDRISVVVRELARLGADIHELPDGFVVRGPSRLEGISAESHGDHRIAMTLAIAALAAGGETVIHDVECAAISYPNFAETLASLGAQIDEG